VAVSGLGEISRRLSKALSARDADHGEDIENPQHLELLIKEWHDEVHKYKDTSAVVQVIANMDVLEAVYELNRIIMNYTSSPYNNWRLRTGGRIRSFFFQAI
jgi:hypothetical protein